MRLGDLARGLDKARSLLASGDYRELLTRLTEHVLPAGNPVAYWDKFVIGALRRPPHRPYDMGAAPTLAKARDIDQLCEQVPDRAPLFRRRFDGGQHCLIINDGSSIVARAWLIADRSCHISNSGFRFVPPLRPALWWHDVFVDPEHRRRGYFAALVASGWELAGTATSPHIYCEIHHQNERSIQAHRRCGFQLLQRITVASVFGLKVYSVATEDGTDSLSIRYALRVPHN